MPPDGIPGPPFEESGHRGSGPFDSGRLGERDLFDVDWGIAELFVKGDGVILALEKVCQ